MRIGNQVSLHSSDTRSNRGKLCEICLIQSVGLGFINDQLLYVYVDLSFIKDQLRYGYDVIVDWQQSFPAFFQYKEQSSGIETLLTQPEIR